MQKDYKLPNSSSEARKTLITQSYKSFQERKIHVNFISEKGYENPGNPSNENVAIHLKQKM